MRRVREKTANPNDTLNIKGWNTIFKVSDTSPDFDIFIPQTNTCQETMAKNIMVMK
jgi:hypothetical protein